MREGRSSIRAPDNHPPQPRDVPLKPVERALSSGDEAIGRTTSGHSEGEPVGGNDLLLDLHHEGKVVGTGTESPRPCDWIGVDSH